ncbi:hypothetical protein Q8A73_015779 [Channa argus]|nr:hypothetical protein Q8A73_015779 [Channa argus]
MSTLCVAVHGAEDASGAAQMGGAAPDGRAKQPDKEAFLTGEDRGEMQRGVILLLLLLNHTRADHGGSPVSTLPSEPANRSLVRCDL